LESIRAYVSCVSGAMLKDKYIEVIREAGFGEIAVLQEVLFPIELTANDLTAQVVKESLSDTALTGVSNAVASVAVRAFKQGGTG